MAGNNYEGERRLCKEWKLVWRAMGILNEMLPHLWLYQVLGILTDTFSPYFGLYMSAQLVNELAGDCDYRRLLMLAGITVLGGFLLSFTAKILQSKRAIYDNFLFDKHEAYLADAQNDFQYEHLENPEVVHLRTSIFAGMNATGAGLVTVKWQVSDLISNILGVIFSVSLTVSMFTMAAQGQYTGIFGFINSPASAVVILGLIILNAFCSIKISAASVVRQQKALGKLAADNTHYSIFCRLWGADMIMFDLNRVVIEEFRKRRLRPKWVAEREETVIRYNSLSIILNAVVNVVLFFFTAAKAYIGVFGIGSFILYQGTIRRFVAAVSGIASDLGGLRHNNSYLALLYEYLDLPNDMYKGTLAVEKRDDIDYEIEFRDVSFKYPGGENWALRHVSMKFKIGDKLAIVGENGSGKTTFIKLLCRLYDPTEGKILLNGIDITRYRYEEYMALFSVVFQDYALFGFPLGENVAVKLDYDEDRVRDCLVRAGLGNIFAPEPSDSDAGDLPEQAEAGPRQALDKSEEDKPEEDKSKSLEKCLHTKEKNVLKRAIGREYDSEGIDFSGGERQKIALARALYKDAPFVVLDEPTAALDPIAEAAVYENFNVLVENKTAVFISHRLSSCRFCDSIAVFDHGQLIQQGTHDALAADAGGKYSQLWHAQAQYYEK